MSQPIDEIHYHFIFASFFIYMCFINMTIQSQYLTQTMLILYQIQFKYQQQISLNKVIQYQQIESKPPMQQGEQQILISIQPYAPPTSAVKKVEVFRQVDLKMRTDQNRLDLYLTINKIYMKNLLDRKQRADIPAPIKNHIGMNAILYKEFTINQYMSKMLIGQNNQIKGNIHILYHYQLNIQIKIYFKQKIVRSQDNIWLLLNYYSNLGTWKTKNIQLSQLGNKFSCKIPLSQLNQYMEMNLLLNFAVRRRQQSSVQHLGIINLGNTCFMSSCLQMLYYIRPLRKIIIQKKTQSRVIHSLRQVFISLMDIQQHKPIDIEHLLVAYDRFNEIPRRQQDVQQFLLDFINQLEKECQQLKILWQGKCTETTFSREKNKRYSSSRQQEFFQLDVHMSDAKGNFFENIEESLQSLIHQQDVQQFIQNDVFGKILVSKKKCYKALPDILFINVKRYTFDKSKLQLSKILSPISYPSQQNIQFLIAGSTPGNSYPSHNPQCNYSLFSIIVHKGSSPHNGHYFSFVNTSSEYKTPEWFEFNDSVVRKTEEEEVLRFTGKKEIEIIIDKKEGRYFQKEMESDQSSYLLVYIRTQVFNQYQGQDIPIPKDYMAEKLKKQAQKQNKNIQQVNLLTFSRDDSLDLLGSETQFTQVPMNTQSLMIQQLKKIESTFLGVKARRFYTVNINKRRIRPLQNYQSVKQITIFKRGEIDCSYILLIPQQLPNYDFSPSYQPQNESSSDTVLMSTDILGIIHIVENQLEEQLKIPKFVHTSLELLNQLEATVYTLGGRVQYETQKKDFQTEWNSYVQIRIFKN